jgi:hypothetical protein
VGNTTSPPLSKKSNRHGMIIYKNNKKGNAKQKRQKKTKKDKKDKNRKIDLFD